jgi:mono/diheme cytochrome c family protein
LTVLAGWLAGCDLPGRPRSEDRYIAPRNERAFAVLYQRNCAGCHGVDGTFGPAPPLNDKLFLALIPDSELRRVVAEGRPGTLMPAFAEEKGGQLTSEQVEILTSGIKTRWSAKEPPPSVAPAYLLSKDQAESGLAQSKKEGLEVFARACASCHGDLGQGTTNGDNSVGAINDPNFLALTSDQALRRYVITGRPDLGMPNYADPKGRAEGFQPLTSRDVANVVALLAEWRPVPSGERKGN